MKKDVTEFWVEMIAHINESWKKRKNTDLSYPFTGRDFKDLKHFAQIFKPWGLMALWDLYIWTDNAFNEKTGYSIFQFTRQLPYLTDQQWKQKAQFYEHKMIGKLPDKIASILTLKIIDKKH